MVRLVRKRYVIFKFASSQFLTKRELLTFINDKLDLANCGDYLQRKNIRIINYNPILGLCIVRCDTKTASALRNIKNFPNEPSIKTIRTSGSIKALKRRLDQFNS